MKIALVHDYLNKLGGAEKVLLSLCKLYPDAPIFTLLYDEKDTKGLYKDHQIITSSLQKQPYKLRKSKKFLLPFYEKAIEEFNFSEYDIVISSSNSFAHGILTNSSTFHACYCHSPMRFVWDWYHEYLVENKIDKGIKGLIIRNVLHKIRQWDYVASKRVDLWIANSQNTKDRISKYYRQDSIVIEPPVNVESIYMSQQDPEDYYLIVSRIEPYKKIDLAVEAFNQNNKKLVIIGEGSARSQLEKIAKSNIKFLGWQSDDSVKNHLQNAKALIFPGEEDFGITPIESMAAGRPVVGYKKGGLVETVIENETGIFFDQESSASLIKAVEKLEKNYEKFNPIKINKYSQKFSEKNFLSKIENTINKGYEKYLNENS